MSDHTAAPYKDDDLLTMEKIAGLWGVKKKTIQTYRFASTHGKPERFPPPDVPTFQPLWYYRTIRDFVRPKQRIRRQRAGSVTG